MAVDNGIFDRYADTWWVEEGTLHALKTSLNPGRFGYFRRVLAERLGLTGIDATVLDVGCGGGFLAEEFARLGCRVTGVDPSWRSLEVAHLHAQREGLDITYRWGRAERLPAADDAYDIVVCCDVLEHVDDPAAAVAELVRVLRPGGVLFFDTINRTAASKLLVIKLMQEWRWSSFVPPRLHDWDKFITPSELEGALRRHGLEPGGMVGLRPRANPLALVRLLRDRKRGRLTYGEFGRRLELRETPNTSVAYMGYATKPPRAARTAPARTAPARRAPALGERVQGAAARRASGQRAEARTPGRRATVDVDAPTVLVGASTGARPAADRHCRVFEAPVLPPEKKAASG